MNPPLQKPFDLQKYREQYLSFLRLEASNNQKISNAVMLLKTTGQLPVPPLDVRTTTEKLADLEGSKVQLRALLQQVTDGGIAGQIISSLDSDQIAFAIQNWDTIQKDMTKKYGLGVPLNVFIVYLNKLIDDTQKAQGVRFGLQLASGNNIVLSVNQIFADYGDLLKELGRLTVQANATMGIDIPEARNVIQDNISTGLSRADQAIFDDFSDADQNTILDLINTYYKLVMLPDTLLEFINKLDKSIKDKEKDTTQNLIYDIIDKFTITPEVMENRIKIRDLIRKSGGKSQLALPANDLEELELALTRVAPTKKPKAIKDDEEPSSSSSAKPKKNKVPTLTSFPKDLEWGDILEKKNKVGYLNARLAGSPDLVLTADGESYGMNVNGKKKKILAVTGTKVLNKLYMDYIAKSENKTIGNGLHSKMKGKGLVEKPYRQSIAHLIDTEEIGKVERPKMYVPFGRYFINRNRLNQDGIIAFRTPSGNVIPNLSTEKVSSSMAKVMKSLIGGGMPEFDNISGLNEDEKDKLFHICKTCKVDTPAVPKSFRKGVNEKEEDRFNILRGQIIAGNDSPVIAKEFKLLLLKLMNSERIPKRQANEILQELLILGY
jgi:hypothetical protein